MYETQASRGGGEGVRPIPDFSADIASAMAAAPLFDEAASVRTARRSGESYRSCADDYLITSAYEKPDYCVVTEDPAAYEALVEQAFLAAGVANGFKQDDPDLLLWAQNVVKTDGKHEIAHGEALTRYSLPGTFVYYGVHLYTEQQDGQTYYGFKPFVQFKGAIAKVHLALARLAPDEPPEQDLAFVRGLGYDPERINRIVRRARRVPLPGEAKPVRRGLTTPVGFLADLVLRELLVRKHKKTAPRRTI